MTILSAIEMFDDLVRRGYVTPARIEPSSLMMPTAYVTVPTRLAFVTPAIEQETTEGGRDAKLGSRPTRDTKRATRAKR